MGAAESNPIRNMDKRSARRTYRSEFSAAIEMYRSSSAVAEQQEVIISKQLRKDEWDEGSIRVFVRKRPIHREELEVGTLLVVWLSLVPPRP